MARKRNDSNRRRGLPPDWPEFADVPRGEITGRYELKVYALRFNRTGDPEDDKVLTACAATSFDADGNRTGRISPRVIFAITTDLMLHCAVASNAEFEDAIDVMALTAKTKGDPRLEGDADPFAAMVHKNLVAEAVRETLLTTILKATKVQVDVGLPAQRAAFIVSLLERYCGKCGHIKIAGLRCACPPIVHNKPTREPDDS